MTYSKTDLNAYARIARAVFVAGAMTLTNLVSGTILMKGQAFGPADGAFPDSGVGEYCDIFLARIPPQGTRDIDSTKGNATSTYQSASNKFQPALDTLHKLEISGRAAVDTMYKFLLKNYVARKGSGTNHIPTVFFDAPYPPYDTVSAFGLSINVAETLSLAGRGLVGKTLGLAYLLRNPSLVCTTEVFTNGRGPNYLSNANAMWNFEKILMNVNDFDTAKLRVIAIFPDSEYYSETLIPLKPSVYGQAQAIESLSLYQHVIPHVGVGEEEHAQVPRESEPATSSRVTTMSGLQQLIEDERMKGNKVGILDASGRRMLSCKPGVNFVEITGRGRNMGMGKKGRSFSKYVCAPNGRFFAR